LTSVSAGNAHSFLKLRGSIRNCQPPKKPGLTGLYKKFLLMPTMAISKPFFHEVDGTVILPLTFIKGVSIP